MALFDFKQEIKRLENKKWEILMRHGPQVASIQWKSIDERLNKLYSWWTNQMCRRLK